MWEPFLDDHPLSFPSPSGGGGDLWASPEVTHPVTLCTTAHPKLSLATYFDYMLLLYGVCINS